MSVDNVIAIAGAAQSAGEKHQLPLVIFGLLVSIPIIVWGSQLVLKLMDRFPIIITLGPLAMGDKFGPANILEVLFNMQTVYGDPRYRPSPWLRRRGAIGLSLMHEEA